MTPNDLLAVTPLSDYDAESGTSWDHLLVGGTGTLVVLGTTFDESSSSSFVETKQFAGVALRGALEIPVNGVNEWWVVGDLGLAAYSIDRATTWTSVVLNSTANLHDITRFEEAIVLVGDEVIFVRQANGIWAELPAPATDARPDEPSWGPLRAVTVHEGRLYAAGLGGRLWSSSMATAGWDLELLETGADLFALGAHEGVLRAVGAGGTMLELDGQGQWTLVDTGTTLDLIDYERGAALTSEGSVLASLDDADPPFELVPALTGARALSYGGELILVGDAGAAQRSEYFACADG